MINPFPDNFELLRHRPSPSQINLAVTEFTKHGHTNHSKMRLLLPWVMRWCEENRISYRLTAHPGQGYYIERIKPLDGE